MLNIRIMNGEYSKEKDYMLFGYTYIQSSDFIAKNNNKKINGSYVKLIDNIKDKK